jgi:hypothetical protein
MTVKNLNVPKEEIAREFSRILRAWIRDDLMAKIVELTRAETDAGICHTGDYVDSNMAMYEAMVNLGVMDDRGFDADDDAAVALWNASWDEAKKSLFYTEES